MDHREISSKGGNATKKKYGKEFFSKIGKRGAKVKLKKYGTDYFMQLSQLGVMARRKKAEMKNKVFHDIPTIVQSEQDNQTT